MRIEGYCEMSDDSYKEALEYAFADFIMDDTTDHNKEDLAKAIETRMYDEFPDMYLSNVDKMVEDTKKYIKGMLNDIE